MGSIIDTVHCYAISRTSDSRYVTYVDDKTKPNGRRQIRRKTKSALYAFLLEYYGITEEKKELIFADLYREWVEYKRRFIGVKNRKRGLSPSTIRRYERDYDKYISHSKLAAKMINKLSTNELELILASIIEENHMSEKCAGNIIGYISQVFAFARRSEYIQKNPAEIIDKEILLAVCVFTEPKDDSARILTQAEMKALYIRIKARHEERRNRCYMPDYAIELAMLTGMRVGELAALHWSDIHDDFIHIDYSEHRLDYSDKPSELVIGEPKNGKHRSLPVTSEIRDLFNRIRDLPLNREEDFIFVRSDGSRCTAHDISCAVDRRAKEAGVKKTSIHGIRRTISSFLNTLLPQKAVADMLGHSERVNEAHYNYSTAENNEKKCALSEVSSKVINFPAVSGTNKIAESL